MLALALGLEVARLFGNLKVERWLELCRILLLLGIGEPRIDSVWQYIHDHGYKAILVNLTFNFCQVLNDGFVSKIAELILNYYRTIPNPTFLGFDPALIPVLIRPLLFWHFLGLRLSRFPSAKWAIAMWPTRLMPNGVMSHLLTGLPTRRTQGGTELQNLSFTIVFRHPAWASQLGYRGN